MSKNDDLKYWIALSCNLNIGPKTFQKLIKNFPSMAAVWQADKRDFIHKRVDERIFNAVKEVVLNINPGKEIAKMKKLGISAITIRDKSYPKLLKELPDPPGLLYYKGKLEDIESAIAVVGSRKISDYGRQATIDIVEPLALAGITIVSGLALGIDSVAHQSAVDCQGKTIAVLGSGLDRIYPTNNISLADKILQKGGAIISEFPLGTPPYRSNFPLRNRIVAGLTVATLVVEASLKSGALITAAAALDNNRQVFAVPGSIYTENSAGVNNLIKMGAKPVTCADDILEELNIKPATDNHKKVKFDNPEEEILAKYLKSACHIDKLTKQTKLDIAAVNATLTLMEIKGLVKNLGSNNYILK